MPALLVCANSDATSSNDRSSAPFSPPLPLRAKTLVPKVDSSESSPDNWEASTTTAVRPDEHCTGSADLGKLYSELLGLKSPNREDGESPATQYAFEKAFDIIQKAAYRVMQSRCGSFPKGYASTDELGGIRVEWWSGKTHSVHLVVSSAPGGDDYLFCRLGPGDRGHIRRPASDVGLADLIARFNKSIKG